MAASNPLLARSSVDLVVVERGSDAAAQQLQDHCDKLNRMNGDRYWFVVGEAPNRTVSNGPRAKASDSADRASPNEVAQIMRHHGLG